MNIVDNSNLLEVKNLSVEIKLKNEIISPIKNISFLIRQNTSNAIIGESGSGKSILASTLINLLPINSRITDGSIHYKGKNITNKGTNIRGKEISIDSFKSLEFISFVLISNNFSFIRVSTLSLIELI